MEARAATPEQRGRAAGPGSPAGHGHANKHRKVSGSGAQARGKAKASLTMTRDTYNVLESPCKGRAKVGVYDLNKPLKVSPPNFGLQKTPV